MRLDAIKIRPPRLQMVFEVTREALEVLGARDRTHLGPHPTVDPASTNTFRRRVLDVDRSRRLPGDQKPPLRRVDLVRTVQDFDGQQKGEQELVLLEERPA